MDSCPLLRASTAWRKLAADGRTPPKRVGTCAPSWLVVPATLIGWLSGRALRDLLNAIPDSNDDFGLF